jgi:hypothetical protein
VPPSAGEWLAREGAARENGWREASDGWAEPECER